MVLARLDWLFLLLQGTLALALDVTVSLAPPSTASPISRDHIGYSLEQDRWLDWVGSRSPNQFYLNTLENLRKLSGVPPHIRVGANSEDRTHFNPNIEFAQLVFPTPSYNVPYPEATKIVVGDGYYAATRFLPRNTRVTWGLNLGSNNLTAAYLMAQSIAKTFSSSAIADAGIKLDAIEIGNEPDLYGRNGLRGAEYATAQYVREWTAIASNVTDVLKISKTSYTKFLGASLATSSRSTSGWSPQALFSQGYIDSAPGSLISTISQHRYSGSFCTGNSALLQDLMTKSTIRSNISINAPDIAAVRARGLDYILGETNSFACHGAPGVSNVAGAALWTLEYALAGAQAGISRIFFHQGIGFKYNFVQPVTLDRSPVDATPLDKPLLPHVQPQYYAAIITAEATGPSGNTKIVDIPVSDSRISAYGFYDGTALNRIVFIESTGYFKQSSNVRRTTHIDLKFNGGTAPRQMKLKRLSVPYAEDETGLTWGGISYDTSSGLPSGTESVETVDVSKGFDIRGTEVVMISFVR